MYYRILHPGSSAFTLCETGTDGAECRTIVDDSGQTVLEVTVTPDTDSRWENAPEPAGCVGFVRIRFDLGPPVARANGPTENTERGALPVDDGQR